jgi:hypothetical protein
MKLLDILGYFCLGIVMGCFCYSWVNDVGIFDIIGSGLHFFLFDGIKRPIYFLDMH